MPRLMFEDIRLLDGPFDPQEIIQATADSTMSKGGVANFTGYVSSSGDVEALELSHYEPLTLPGMEDLARAARDRFDITAITIVHRLGRMVPGDPIVCVAAASRHRRDAINAVDFAMDHLKSAAWFWKRELRGGTWHWIEPRGADHSDLARWKSE
ncbi:molybdenum cofactor biosynthesis protein MoaE [Erythrobacter ani]|uniref:Molybdenum cofactor biosynthesis protein MoaE n=1 Tax=Erythrobacter ani TaxID=2827235 RepID=A0ABS6SI13_9SPHN|nr:molybdenum cofactor biosynthesis protein MoaE [Erythrobacter ani]MBV7264656.1 molybdenum cofactor biosynthesis protein MoaE [Erythrobacter ani]